MSSNRKSLFFALLLIVGVASNETHAAAPSANAGAGAALEGLSAQSLASETDEDLFLHCGFGDVLSQAMAGIGVPSFFAEASPLLCNTESQTVTTDIPSFGPDIIGPSGERFIEHTQEVCTPFVPGGTDTFCVTTRVRLRIFACGESICIEIIELHYECSPGQWCELYTPDIEDFPREFALPIKGYPIVIPPQQNGWFCQYWPGIGTPIRVCSRKGVVCTTEGEETKCYTPSGIRTRPPADLPPFSPPTYPISLPPQSGSRGPVNEGAGGIG